ncbi:MAG: DUF2089 domain-containing protein [Sarcina sp.]
MHKVLTKCPVCMGKLKVTKLKCTSCSTIIENDFIFSKFETLNKEELKFVEVFLQCRGSIKDVEKELGISYPTVRGKLDEIIKNLGLISKKDAEVNKEKILEMLEKGEITSEEALKLLEKK